MGSMKDLLGDTPAVYPETGCSAVVAHPAGGRAVAGSNPASLTISQFPDGIPEEVCRLYEKLAFDVEKRGFKRYSSDAILHRIRWHFHIDKGDREFKCNDHWTATLARWFLGRHPEMDGFFELRQSPKMKNEMGE